MNNLTTWKELKDDLFIDTESVGNKAQSAVIAFLGLLLFRKQ